ncbi:MAG: tetratricopeptide repeat protein [Opitutae bacterium]|nr:tetratricopeptide repeat protein [Opitutae bacterium]
MTTFSNDPEGDHPDFFERFEAWRSSPRLLRRLGIAAAVLALVAGVAAWRWWASAEARALAKAAEFQEVGDWRRAELLLQQALDRHPGSLPAHRAYAAFLDRVNRPDAVELWRRVVALSPDDVGARLKFAAAAVRSGQFDEARRALQAVPTTAREAEYHRLAAALALVRGDSAEARARLRSVVARAPDDARARLSLALEQLKAAAEEQERGRQELERLSRQPATALRATLELMQDAERRWPGAADAEEILADRILLGAAGAKLRAAGESGRMRLLRHLWALPVSEPADVAVFLRWSAQEGLAREALRWWGNQTAVDRSHLLVQLPLAECAIAAGDWGALRDALKRGAWGPVMSDVVDEAFVLHAQGVEGAGDWLRVRERAVNSVATLQVLAQLARLWGNDGRAEQTWRMITRQYPQERRAWGEMRAIFLRRGDTAALKKLYAEWEASGAASADVKIERRILALLTGDEDAVALREISRFAEELPDSESSRALRALVLRAEGRGAEALALMEAALAGNPPPRWSLIFGVLLAENGRGEEAERALAKVSGPLLPEEEALRERARGRIAASRPRR